MRSETGSVSTNSFISEKGKFSKMEILFKIHNLGHDYRAAYYSPGTSHFPVTTREQKTEEDEGGSDRGPSDSVMLLVLVVNRVRFSFSFF